MYTSGIRHLKCIEDEKEPIAKGKERLTLCIQIYRFVREAHSNLRHLSKRVAHGPDLIVIE